MSHTIRACARKGVDVRNNQSYIFVAYDVISGAHTITHPLDPPACYQIITTSDINTPNNLVGVKMWWLYELDFIKWTTAWERVDNSVLSALLSTMTNYNNALHDITRAGGLALYNAGNKEGGA